MRAQRQRLASGEVNIANLSRILRLYKAGLKRMHKFYKVAMTGTVKQHSFHQIDQEHSGIVLRSFCLACREFSLMQSSGARRKEGKERIALMHHLHSSMRYSCAMRRLFPQLPPWHVERVPQS